MKKSRWIALLLVFALVASLFIGCAGSTEEPAAEPSGDEPYEIAVVVKIIGIPFFNVMEDGVKKAAEEFGVNAYVTGPTDADPAQQVKIIEDLITKGVDAIVVVPNDAKALEAVLLKAQENGILVLTTESPGQNGADWDLEMIDNAKFAYAAVDAAAKEMGGKGEFVMFVGGLSVPLHNTWADYVLEYTKEKYPEMVEVTDRIPCGEDADLARTKTLELLKAYPDLKAVIGWGSLGPIGAAEALREKGLTDAVSVTGTVVPSQAAQYLADGSITEGVLWNPSDSGYASVFTAKYILDGNDVAAADFEVPNIGKPTITDKVMVFDATLVITKDNAESLGF